VDMPLGQADRVAFRDFHFLTENDVFKLLFDGVVPDRELTHEAKWLRGHYRPSRSLAEIAVWDRQLPFRNTLCSYIRFMTTKSTEGKSRKEESRTCYSALERLSRAPTTIVSISKPSDLMRSYSR